MLAMVYSAFRSLSPAGLQITNVEIVLDRILIAARCRGDAGMCPDCGRSSKHVHSRYERRLLDLPSQVAPFRCGLRFGDFAAPIPIAGAAFLPSRSVMRWLEDRRGAPLGSKRSSIISASLWVVGPRPRWHVA